MAVDFRKRFIVEPGSKVRLGKIDPDDTAGIRNKAKAAKLLADDAQRLARLQYVLYADGRKALLVVLQAMDAGGKDGTIRHVMGPLNPQGVEVTSFKTPSIEELSHDYLWRVHKRVPPRGMIGIFNRSHYEDVLIVRVHELVAKGVWSKRYRQINDFERLLSDSGVRIVKFYLHISPEEQLERLKARLADPTKHWKVDPNDLKERRRWDQYAEAYEEAISRCSTEWAPWYIIPANHKWFRNAAVSDIIGDTLQEMDLHFPKPTWKMEELQIE